MRTCRKAVLFVLLVFAGGASAGEQSDCLKDGDTVSLVGKVWRETFPGRPNYENIENGDEPETVWVLTLDQPRCVLGVSMESGKTYEIGRVARFQLVLTPEQYKKHRNLLERRAIVRGQLFQAMTGHHHTKALIEAKELGPAVSTPSHANAQSFVAQYSRAKTPDFDRFNRELRRNHVLEEIAAKFSELVTLPTSVTITIAECGNANAFYSPQHRAIVLCYELFGQMTNGIQRSFQNVASPQEIKAAASGGLSFIFIHELGHALINVLDIPVLGREEDAADQIAAYLILQSSGNSPSYGLAGALWFFRSNTLLYTRRHFSDEHSLGPQRQSNLACWAFGKNPARYQYLLTGRYLTPERASRCGAEYQKLDASVRKLLGNNVRFPNR